MTRLVPFLAVSLLGALAVQAQTETPDITAMLAQHDRLTLDEVLGLVEANYPKLLGAEVLRQVADAKLLSKRGAFDPKISFKSEEISYVEGKLDKFKRKNQLQLEVPTRSGIKWFAGARLTDATEARSTKVKDNERPFVGATIPLLRNARINAKLAAERQAALDVPLAEAELQSTRLKLFEKAGTAYWDWVAAVQERRVASDMIELAKERANAVDAQVEHGDKPELTAVEAQREIQKRLGILAKAQRNVEKTSFKLSLFLWDSGGEPIDPPKPSRAPEAAPNPVGLRSNAVPLAEAKALALRPELGAVSTRRSQTGIDLELARNGGKPDLSVFFNTGRESALDVFEPIERRYRAGLKLSVPLRRRKPRGQAQAARLKLRKLDLERTLVAQAIRVQVRDAASRIRTDLARFEAADQELNFARRLEEGERRRFDLGDGTLFLVNQRERSRAEAQIKRIQITADYHQARLSFRAVVGDLTNDVDG